MLLRPFVDRKAILVVAGIRIDPFVPREVVIGIGVALVRESVPRVLPIHAIARLDQRLLIGGERVHAPEPRGGQVKRRPLDLRELVPLRTESDRERSSCTGRSDTPD